jgi:preprotein translocase subunit SecY
VFVIPKYRRKTLLLVGMLVMWQCYAMMFSIYPEMLSSFENKDDDSAYTIILTIIISFFVLGYSMTLGPIPWMYLPEIMTEIGMGIAVSINWLIVILISYLPSIASKVKTIDGKYDQPDMSPFFFVFGGFWIISFFLISLFVKETKGLDPKQILK